MDGRLLWKRESALTPVQGKTQLQIGYDLVSNSIRIITKQKGKTERRDKERKRKPSQMKRTPYTGPLTLPIRCQTPARPEGTQTRQKTQGFPGKFQGEGNDNRWEGTSSLGWEGTSGSYSLQRDIKGLWLAGAGAVLAQAGDHKVVHLFLSALKHLFAWQIHTLLDKLRCSPN